MTFAISRRRRLTPPSRAPPDAFLMVGNTAGASEQPCLRSFRLLASRPCITWPGRAPPTPAIAMLCRGIEYSVVQGIVRHHWKWAATVSGTKISGYGRTRHEAIGNAKKAIERAIQKQRFKQDLDGED